ncbi:hypothetical protein [Phreatobacter sp.]|uniref:hypothetical protein n=1 Tax=Phreatobacter sp. TaxID=1966341 RepID=UPI003F6F6F2D
MSTATRSFALALFRTDDTVTFLRRLLAFDAITSGAMGLKLAVGAGILAPWLGLPEGLLRAAGLMLVPFAIAVAIAAARAPSSRAAVLSIAAVNALWVIASLGLLVSGLVSPGLLGMAFVAAQAVFVGVLAELQIIGARRLATA